MLRTYSDFMKEINNISILRDLWSRMAKVSEDGSYCYEMLDNLTKQEEALCEKYPIFNTMYKLNQARERA